MRSARDADRDAIARVWLDGWQSTGIRLAEQPDYVGLRSRVDEELANGWRVTVADWAGEVLGFAALRPDLAKLDQIFVKADALGQGIGAALMAHARRAMPDGFSLWTHADNARARRFYENQAPLRFEDGMHPTHGHPIRTYWFAGERNEAPAAALSSSPGEMSMDDARVWSFEEKLWLGGEEVYRALIDEECVMALPAAPFVYTAEAAIAAVANTPRWSSVDFNERKVQRPEEGLIVIAYRADAKREGEAYTAYCTTSIRRRGHEDWLVVQHSQVVPPVAGGAAG